MTEVIEVADQEVPVKPRRPHRRTRPLPEPEPVPVAVPEVPPVVEVAEAEPQPLAYLVSMAQSRRERERRRLVLEIEAADKEAANRTLRLRGNCAPLAEVDRVSQQFAQVVAEKTARLAAIEAMSNRGLVLSYVAESAWAQAAVARSV